MADAGVGDLDRDVVGAQVAALELHQLQRLVGGVGAPSLGCGSASSCLLVVQRARDEDRLRLDEMGAVDHSTIHRQHASVRLGRERGDDRLARGRFRRRTG